LAVVVGVVNWLDVDSDARKPLSKSVHRGVVMLDDDVDEADPVLKSEHFVGEARRFALVLLGEHCLDQPLILIGSLGLRLVAHHSGCHRWFRSTQRGGLFRRVDGSCGQGSSFDLDRVSTARHSGVS
jgi:hypothetical protein